MKNYSRKLGKYGKKGYKIQCIILNNLTSKNANRALKKAIRQQTKKEIWNETLLM